MKKKFKVMVDGEEFEVEVEEISPEEGKNKISSKSDKAESLSSQRKNTAQNKSKSPAPKPATKKRADSAEGVVESPMSGKVLQIKYSEGEEVTEGELIIILEAMKMENEIYAPHSGTINKIAVTEGDTVEAGEPLLEIE